MKILYTRSAHFVKVYIPEDGIEHYTSDFKKPETKYVWKLVPILCEGTDILPHKAYSLIKRLRIRTYSERQKVLIKRAYNKEIQNHQKEWR
jgi:hypothetical protein